MPKTKTARKSPHKHVARAGNPVEWAMMQNKIQREIEDLITTSDLQASWGDSPAGTIERCGRVIFVIAFAVGRCRVPEDLPEVRILRSMANTIEQLSHDHSSLDQHRASLSSGLQAVKRLLPRLSVWSIGEGSLVLDQLRQQDTTVTLHHLQRLIQAPAALPSAARSVAPKAPGATT